MLHMNAVIKPLILSRDFEGLDKVLGQNPTLANEGIPYDDANPVKAHPLHRICDAVFNRLISDEDAVKFAKIFLAHGATVNGNEMEFKKDTPLIAAASLHADKVGILYVETGAELSHAGCHGGTALHWAAWCGRPALVEKLIDAGAPINKRCVDFESTPLFWTIHGFKSCDFENHAEYFNCARMLMNAGSDASIANAEGYTVFDLLGDKFPDLMEILRQKIG